MKRFLTLLLIILAAATAACSSDDTPASVVTPSDTTRVPPVIDPRSLTLELVAVPPQSDTIQATPTQTLTTRVTDANGKPVAGQYVSFIGSRFATGVQLMSATDANFAESAAAKSDSLGIVAVRIRMGTQVGTTIVTATITLNSKSKSIPFVTTVGQPALMTVTPTNVALARGETVQFAVTVTDRFKNARTDPFTFSTVGSVVTVTPGGLATGIEPGTQNVVFGVNARLIDSVPVMVPPSGRLMWTNSLLNILLEADMTNGPVAQVAVKANYVSYLGTSKDIVFNRTGMIVVRTEDGTETVVSPSTIVNATFPDAADDDASWIYFQSGLDAEPQHLHRIHPDGFGLDDGFTSILGQTPAVSPDGKTLAFGTPLQVMNLQTANVITIDAGVIACMPRWSPDGQWIAYVDAFKCATVGPMYVIHPNGSGKRRIGTSNWGPGVSWSPDGKWLLGSDAGNINIINVATGQAHALSRPGLYPLWER